MTRHSSFPPIVDTTTHTLILGSLPGAASLRAQRYYAHPRNQFWRLLGAVLEVDLPGLDYEAKLAAVLARGFGLWDVIAHGERVGSLDAAIRQAQPHDLQTLTESLPKLETIAFNGGTAARIGARQLTDLVSRYRLLALPSSSPAHAVPFQDKLRRWHALRERNATNDSAELQSVM